MSKSGNNERQDQVVKEARVCKAFLALLQARGEPIDGSCEEEGLVLTHFKRISLDVHENRFEGDSGR